MPDLHAILAFYQAYVTSSLTGALPGEATCFARPERQNVIERFLHPLERQLLPALPGAIRAARLKIGEKRFCAWEAANPDIVDALMRRAEARILSHTRCAESLGS